MTETSERIRATYDRFAGRYDRGMRLTERLLGDGRRAAGEAVRGRVLEVGIGTGLSLPHYPAGVDLTGIDLSAEMLRRAGQRAASLGRQVVLHRMDAERLEFPAAGFDSIAFNLVLCTVPDPGAALAEAVRVCRPGGAIVLLEHVRSDRPPVGMLQDMLSLGTVRLAQDHLNRRAEDAVRAAGIAVDSVRRWALGSLTLVVGRRPDRA